MHECVKDLCKELDELVYINHISENKFLFKIINFLKCPSKKYAGYVVKRESDLIGIDTDKEYLYYDDQTDKFYMKNRNILSSGYFYRCQQGSDLWFELSIKDGILYFDHIEDMKIPVNDSRKWENNEVYIYLKNKKCPQGDGNYMCSLFLFGHKQWKMSFINIRIIDDDTLEFNYTRIYRFLEDVYQECCGGSSYYYYRVY